MDTLTATLAKGRLTFDRRVFLGGTYLLAFAGEADGVSGLALHMPVRDGRVNLAQSVTAGETVTIAFTNEELIGEFRGCAREVIGFDAWLCGGTAPLGAGTLGVEWSPLVVDIETGRAASLKGDAGVGIESVSKDGTTVTFALTDGSTHDVDIADLKGEKGDTGSVLNETAAGMVEALADGEPSNINAIYAELAAIKAILKALDT
jgi:hypothetical protein